VVPAVPGAHHVGLCWGLLHPVQRRPTAVPGHLLSCTCCIIYWSCLYILFREDQQQLQVTSSLTDAALLTAFLHLLVLLVYPLQRRPAAVPGHLLSCTCCLADFSSSLEPSLRHLLVLLLHPVQRGPAAVLGHFLSCTCCIADLLSSLLCYAILAASETVKHKTCAAELQDHLVYLICCKLATFYDCHIPT